MSKIFHQAGHNTKWNLDSFRNEDVGQGIIFSPVNVPCDSMRGYSDEVIKASFVDPQLYLPHDSKGKLGTYDYFPESFSPNWRTIDYNEIAAEAAERCFHFQEEMEFGYRVIPSRHVRDLTANTFKVASDTLVEPFLRAWRSSSAAPVLMTVIVKRMQVMDAQQRSELLNWMTSFYDLRGIYLIFESDHTYKQIKDSEYLAGCMDLIRSIRHAGMEVHVGYVNAEAMLFAAAGATSISVGSYENLRKFKVSRFESVEKQGRGPNPRLYVPKLYQWIEYGYVGALNRLYPDWNHIQEYTMYHLTMFTPQFKWHFAKPELYKHYFICVKRQIDAMFESGDPLQYLYQDAIEALGRFGQIRDSGVVLDGDSDGSHLTHWINAINMFRLL